MISWLSKMTCPEDGWRISISRLLVEVCRRHAEKIPAASRTSTNITGTNHFFMPTPSLMLTQNNRQKFPVSGQPISRILSRVRIYLGKLSPACSCGLPGDQSRRADAFSCSTLHRTGVALPTLLPKSRGSLTPPFQPYTHWMRYVSVARSESLRPPRCYLASSSVVYGLSSLI